jgi:hypothetical protein
MRLMKRTAATVIALVFVGAALPTSGRAQDPSSGRPRRSVQTFDKAYQIGFDTGYRKGYELGVDDSRSGDRHEVKNTKEYNRADDQYNSTIGNRDEFRVGYQAGFEKGYDDALMGRQYGAKPGEKPEAVASSESSRKGDGPVLKRSDDPAASSDADAGQYPDPNAPANPDPASQSADPAVYSSGQRRVSYDTSLVVELDTPVTTRYSKAGDRFTARVVDPQVYSDARVEGYLSKVVAPGRVQGKGEVVMTFQRIVFPDGYAEPLEAQVEQVLGYPSGTPSAGKKGPLNRAPWDWGRKQDRNDEIDAKAGDEGQIEGESSTKRDAGTIGGGAVAGAILGGILGGGSGAALGAVLGGAAGGGVVATSKGHHIDLEPGVQIRIRTAQSIKPR